ncbi:exodeoxyribonuclease V subunit alpha [Colwellia sp. E2M01]|uniref:exodeoxyribonuclease V subunit alpha n=1 Tax=Colwellia sp. E2M01 TaxID=2841561 RepID=UPI001C08767D|nr:exodeoxyribonuclease V subunit alpha [Colwellia sp. E2M01]MBU2870513.1 exodeoxyribonuclease V subunit alpha [Colwellia sp. E2M01]
MRKSIYSHFNEANSTIAGIEAIDYFFAKEVLTSLASAFTENTQQIEPIEQIESSEISEQVTADKYANLYHLFLALSASLRAGHSCLPLSDVAGQHWGKSYTSVPKASATALNDQSNAVVNEDESVNYELSHVGFVFASLACFQKWLNELPLQVADQQLIIFDNDKLYMRRYFQFEQTLAQSIKTRLIAPCRYSDDDIRACINELFPDDSQNNDNEVDWQKIAVANAINKNFSVIAGGPGTGKTYTVTKLLAALVKLEQENKAEQIKQPEQGKQTTSALNIALVAPTGKAAQRLSESILDAINGFKDFIDERILSDIPSQAQTIHRLLGVIPNSPNFRHDEHNQLSYDIVLIDEVSMVDLPLMTRVFRALKESTKVILLGDADQLPSVAAGSVLADIAPRPHSGYSEENQHYLADVCQLNTMQQQALSSIKTKYTLLNQTDYLTFLIKSRRFDGKGGIGLIASAVIKGDAKNSWQLLNNMQADTTEPSQAETLVPEKQLVLAEGALEHWLAPLVKEYFQPIASYHDVKAAFTLLSKFRVLCATRQGDYGVEQLNETIKAYLGQSTPFHLQSSQGQNGQSMLYHGLPIMINQNDYRLGLYNGDIGLIWHIEDTNGIKHLMACFEDASATDGIRKILPSRLPQYESVYAMTIHKTQGSEFSHVAMVLSQTESESQNSGVSSSAINASQLLSRELLYTGITRAKKQLTIATTQAVWRQGVIGQVKRHSGLSLE